MVKRNLSFDKLILWLSLSIVIMICLFQYSNYIQRGYFTKILKLNNQKITGIMYYIKQSEDEDINKIAEVSDDNFSYERGKIKTLSGNTWAKFKLSENYDRYYNIVFLDHQFLKINSAYIYVDGRWSKLNSNENTIYSYIKLPSNFHRNQYVYIKLENLNTNFNFNLRLVNEEDFYLYQNRKLIFLITNIIILFVILIINILLYVFTKGKKYFIHSLFLFSLMNALFQISGLQKLLLGFNDLNSSYLWTFITIITGMYFAYHYYAIKKVTLRLRKLYQFLLISNFLFVMLICFLKLSVFTTIVSAFIVFVCVTGLLISICAYLYTQELSRFYIVVVLLFLLSITIFTLASYGVLVWNDFTSDLLYQMASIEAVLFTVGIMRQIKVEKMKVEKLEIEASTDRLTKLFNRSYFEKIVIPKVFESDEKHGNTSLLILDIDLFKNINDTFGHNVGDVLLVELANVITTTVRKQDDVIRWGGEEFIIVLFNTTINSASVIAEKIRSIIEAYEFEYVKKITVSIGVAERHVNEDINSWIEKADKALYRAKRDGRNRVSVCYSN